MSMRFTQDPDQGWFVRGQDHNSLISELRSQLGPEGFVFRWDDMEREGGFRRLYIGKGRGGGGYDAFLDLRIGPPGRAGNVIEMATSKPGTFAVPGFGRHVYGRENLTSTINTFSDYLRSVWDMSREREQTPTRSFWEVYQEGYGKYQYPKAGEVLDPGSSTGKRSYVAEQIRYYLPEGIRPEEYVQGIMAKMMAPAGFSSLAGLVPELERWKAWVPGGQMTRTYEDRYGYPVTEMWMARDPKGAFKSQRIHFDASQVSNVPLVADPNRRGKLVPLPGTTPETGWGVREGWTRSSMVLPGEFAPRDVLSRSATLGEQPDMPGAAYVGPDTYKVQYGGQRVDLEAIGHRGNLSAKLGIRTVDELKRMMEEQQLRFKNLQDTRIKGGTGMFSYGSFKDPNEEKATQLLMEGKDYDIRLNRPTLHIPRFVDPDTGKFSNLPTSMTTEKLAREMMMMYGTEINVEAMSAIGSGISKRDPAEVHINIPIEHLVTPAIKGGGIKAGSFPLTEAMKIGLLGVERKQTTDVYTAEAKIPSRVLMGSFGVMNMQTQLQFINDFLPKAPGSDDARKALRRYITEEYNRPNAEKGVGPAIFADEMASIYTRHTGVTMTGEKLFADMFSNILSVTDEGRAKRLWETYKIGIPIEDFMQGAIYSKDKMLEMKELMKNMEGEVPGLASLIEFERLAGAADTSKGTPQEELYRMSFKVPGVYKGNQGGWTGAGKSIMLQAALTHVPEYSSLSNFINRQGIMSLMAQAPHASREMGITGELGGPWLGPLTDKLGGERPKHVRGWNEIVHWLGFQQGIKDYVEGASEKLYAPTDAAIMTDELASELRSIVAHAEAEPTSEEMLKVLTERMDRLDLVSLGAVENRGSSQTGFRLSEMMLLDRNSMTLIPKVTTMADIESFETGVRAGETKTHFGDRYISLLKGAINSALGDGPSGYRSVAHGLEQFMGRMKSALYPGGKRSKDIFRHLTGVQMPGTTYGRYMQLPQLPSLNAWADDDFIRKALSNKKFKDRGDIRSIMKYLRSSPEAYLPMLVQRYPDISGQHMFLPIKLRSRDAFEASGIPLPRGMLSKGVLYTAAGTDRPQVGDLDWDPYHLKLLPVSDWNFDRQEHTGVWKSNPAVQKEFDQMFEFYSDSGNTQKILKGMFGSQASDLDIWASTLKEYGEHMKRDNMGNLEKRLKQVKPHKIKDVLNDAADVMNWKGGMGDAYFARMLLQDAASMVMGVDETDKDILNKAYESMGFTYQMYLDRSPDFRGGHTQLETLLSSIGIYGVQGEEAKRYYQMRFKITEQGAEVLGERKLWTPIAWQEMKDSSLALRAMLGFIGEQEEPTVSNEMLAWGFGVSGRKGEVLKALQDPNAFFKKEGGMFSTNRGDILKALINTGAVGYNSPYYLSAAFKAVDRLASKNPQYITDPKIMIPWISGKMTPVQEIMQSREYRYMDMANRLFMMGTAPMRADEFEQLAFMNDTRLGLLQKGVYSAFKQTTGGIAPADDAYEAWKERALELRALMQEERLAQEPIVHASELGRLVSSRSLELEGWKSIPSEYRAANSMQVVLRAMGMPEIMGDRDTPARYFRQQRWESGAQAIQGGIDFEKAYAQSEEAARAGMYHVGEVAKGRELSYYIGGMKLVGTPDFIGYNEVTDKFVIEDTKSPLKRSEGAYTAEWAKPRAMNQANRLQQLSYAYMLEKKARAKTPAEWVDFMRGWGMDHDVDTLGRMQRAAAGGRFDISLRTGRIKDDVLTVHPRIAIDYGEAQRREVEAAIGQVETTLFDPASVVGVASEVYTSLREPGKVPDRLRGLFARSGLPDMARYSLLEKLYNIQGGMTRAAGGGMFGDIPGKRIRVGEAGPEEIIIKNRGIEVVPTHELTESRRARGEDVSQEGYLGRRMAATPDFEATDFSATEPMGSVASRMGGDIGQQVQGLEDFTNVVNSLRGTLVDVATSLQDTMAVLERSRDTTVTIGGRRADPQMDKLQRQFGIAATSFAQHQQLSQSFGIEATEVMIQAFEKAGMGTILTPSGPLNIREQFEGTTSANILLAEARRQNINPELYQQEFRRRKMTDRARVIRQGARQADILTKMLETPGLEETLTVRGQRATVEAIRDESDIDKAQRVEGEAFAESLWMMRQEPGMKRDPRAGWTAEDMRARGEATKKYIKAEENLAKIIEEGGDVQKARNELAQATRERDAELLRTKMAERREAAGPLWDERRGQMMSYEDREKLRDRGIVGVEELEAAEDYETLLGKRTSLRAPKAQGAAAGLRNMAMMARRMLGGFGLMYLGSIGRIMAGPSMRGYEEAIEQQMYAGRAFGARAGGYIPAMTVEERIQRAEAMYGGVGWQGMRSIYAGFLESSPGAVGALGMGQAGVGAAGLAMYVGWMAGAGAATGPIGVGVGVTAALGAHAMNIAGAYREPETTAIELAGRTLSGRGDPTVSFLDKAEMAKFSEILSGRDTSPEGITRQQRLIERLGGMLQAGEVQLGGVSALMSRMGIQTSARQSRTMAAVARAMAPQYEVQPEYLFQSMAMGMEYGMPLTFGPGGTMEMLGAQLQAGFPVEELARGAANLPFLTGAERERRTGEIINTWMQGGGLTVTEVLRQQERQGIQEQLGMMMPNLGFEDRAYFARERRKVPGTGTFVERPIETPYYSALTGAYPGDYVEPPGSFRSAMERTYTTPGGQGPDWIPERWEDVMVQKTYRADLTKEFVERIRAQSPAAQQAYLGRMGAEEAMRLMGLPYEEAVSLFEREYEGLGEEETVARMREDRGIQARVESLARVEAALLDLGDAVPDMTQFLSMTMGQRSLVTQAAQFGGGIQGQLLQGGMAPGAAEQFASFFPWLAANAPTQLPMYQGIMQGDRRAFAQLQRTNPELAAQVAGTRFTGQGGTPISGENFFLVDTNMETGLPTGLRYGTTSLQTPRRSSAYMAREIFGQGGPQEWEAAGFDVEGIRTLQFGGTRGMQDLMMNLQFNQQMAMFGIQRQGIALQEWYMPQQFALQQQYRELGYRQQEWGFQMQERQLAEQQRYFGVTTGLARQGMAMQREFTRGDWEYQDQVRGLQWQWKQEDFAEEVRFQTGRQRRISERGMKRATILHDLEEENIQKKRDQQEQLWDLEDERFEANVQHQQILFELQEENIKKQREFFEERKRLDAEMDALQREYWKRQIQLQKQSIDIQEAYARRMHALQRTMNELNRYIDDADAALSTFGATTMAQLASVLGDVNPLFQQFLKDFQEWRDMMKEEDEGKRLGGEQEEHFGGRVQAGESYSVLEGEIFTPDVSGVITNPNLPWENASVSAPTQSGPIHLTLYIGDEHIADKIIDLVDSAIEV